MSADNRPADVHYLRELAANMSMPLEDMLAITALDSTQAEVTHRACLEMFWFVEPDIWINNVIITREEAPAYNRLLLQNVIGKHLVLEAFLDRVRPGPEGLTLYHRSSALHFRDAIATFSGCIVPNGALGVPIVPQFDGAISVVSSVALVFAHDDRHRSTVDASWCCETGML